MNRHTSPYKKRNLLFIRTSWPVKMGTCICLSWWVCTKNIGHSFKKAALFSNQLSWTVSSGKSHGIYKTSQFNNHNKVLTFSYMYMYLEGFFPVRGDICPRVVWVQVSKHFSKKLEWNKNRVMGISSFLLQNSSHFCFFLFYMPVNWLMQNLEQ